MADKLGESATIHKLPTRAAKGAGKSKPRKSAAQSKPRIPVGKAGLRAKPRDASDERKLREALQLQLIGLRSKHTRIDVEMDVLREKLKEKNEERKIIRAAIETAGMPLKLFDEAYDDGKTSRVDLDRKERLRAIVREAFGEPAGPQQDFIADDKTPEAVKPGVYWESEGYRCGIAGLDPDKLPKPPPEHIQDFQRGINAATSRNAEGLKALGKEKERARPPIGGPAKGAAAAPPPADDRVQPEEVKKALAGSQDPAKPEEEDEDEGDPDKQPASLATEPGALLETAPGAASLN